MAHHELELSDDADDDPPRVWPVSRCRRRPIWPTTSVSQTMPMTSHHEPPLLLQSPRRQ
ncbi:haloacid dehalogenase-like hydrolase [Sesbania bispinosa]|nr:haloacid dehalogenase-like hydrolase [Sesbania bispinosa]